MKFLQSLSAQVSLRTQGAILALGLLFIILDALTEPMNPAIDLAWVTVIICGLPLLINSVQSIWDHLEIHANFLIVIAMVALIAIGDYHTAAYVGLIVHGGFFLEQLITGACTIHWMMTCCRPCLHSLLHYVRASTIIHLLSLWLSCYFPWVPMH